MRRVLAAVGLAGLLAVTWMALPVSAQSNLLGVIGLRTNGSTGPIIRASGASVLAANQGSAAAFEYVPLQAELGLSNPTLAPTFLETTGAGACSNSGGKTYKFAMTWWNESGNTNVGPSSTVYSPSGTTKRAIITRVETPPAGARAWSPAWADSTTGYATWKLCGPSSVWEPTSSSTLTCSCSSSGTAITANTTGTIELSGILNGQIRTAQRVVNTDTDYPVVTPGAGRLTFMGTVPTYTPDSGTNTLTVNLVSSTVKRVCAVGCDATTITAALAAITDASSTKRYTILAEPGEYSEGPTMKDYVTLAGYGGYSTRVSSTIHIPQDFHEIGIVGIHTTDNSSVVCDSTSSTVRGRLYLTGDIFGSPDFPIGGAAASVIDSLWNCDDIDIYDVGNVHQSTWDLLTASDNSRVFSVGSVYRTYSASGASSTDVSASCFRILPGAMLIANGVECDIRLVDASADTGYLAGITMQYPNAGSGATTIKVLNSHIHIEDSSATWSGQAGCYADVQATVATGVAAGNVVDLSGTTCEITITSTSGALAGFYIHDGSDADRASTAFKWHSGEISLTGGATRRTIDVRTGSPAGYTFALGPTLVHPEVYSIVGSATYNYSANHVRNANLSAGCSTPGELVYDTGTTKELCYCDGTTWTCWSATTTTGPTD